MELPPPLGLKALSPLLQVVVYLSSVFSPLKATRVHFSQMAPAEAGKIGFISLHSLSRFKPSFHAALQDGEQQPLLFPFKTLTEELPLAQLN